MDSSPGQGLYTDLWLAYAQKPNRVQHNIKRAHQRCGAVALRQVLGLPERHAGAHGVEAPRFPSACSMCRACPACLGATIPISYVRLSLDNASLLPPPPPLSLRAENNSLAVAFGFLPYCIKAAYPVTLCTSASSEVAASLNGNLAKRPAAICSMMGACTPALNCSVPAGSTSGSNGTGALDMCSSTGAAGGAAVRLDGKQRQTVLTVVCWSLSLGACSCQVRLRKSWPRCGSEPSVNDLNQCIRSPRQTSGGGVFQRRRLRWARVRSHLQHRGKHDYHAVRLQ